MRIHHLLHRVGLQRVNNAGGAASLATARRRTLLDGGIDVVFDVGASGGQYGSLLRAAGYTGRIVSYEPQPDAHRILAGRARGDDRWEAHRCALSDRAGTAILHVSGNSQSSSLLEMLPVHKSADPASATVGTLTVDVRQFRQEILRRSAETDAVYLKLDVQGGEFSLLDDLDPSTLARVAALEVELSLVPLYAGGPLAEDVMARLRRLGFSPATLEPNFIDGAAGRVLQVDALFVA
jgi:FkbM family methyltransferase